MSQRADTGAYYAREGLALALKEENNGMVATFNKYLGMASLLKKDYDTAIYYMENALSVASGTGDDELVAGIDMEMGNIYSKREMFRQAGAGVLHEGDACIYQDRQP